MRVPTVIDVPAVVRNKALAAGAAEWLDGLPALVATFEREWGITVGRPYGDATEAYVVEATFDDGTSAVLKLLVPVLDVADRLAAHYERFTTSSRPRA